MEKAEMPTDLEFVVITGYSVDVYDGDDAVAATP